MKTNASQNAQLYTEFGEMNKLRQQARDKDPEALQQVAEQFEQLFMNMMLKTMRQANDAFASDSPFNSSKVKFFQEMADTQLTKELSESEGKGIGLADIIVKQLGQSYGLSSRKEEQQGQSLSEAEQMLSRAFDGAANMAASAVLAQAYSEKAKPDDKKVDAAEKTEQQKPMVTDSLPGKFNSPEEFVRSLTPLAEKVAGELGIDPKVLLAQAALETGWGKHVIQKGEQSSFNLFNIKADSRWQGDKVQVGTLEFRDGVARKEQASFRAYESYEDSFTDYVNFLKGSTRYQQALSQAHDPQAYLRGLQDAGYATDPEYAAKISRIFAGDVLNTDAATLASRATDTKST